MSSRMCRGNKILLTLFGASSPDYQPCVCDWFSILQCSFVHTGYPETTYMTDNRQLWMKSLRDNRM